MTATDLLHNLILGRITLSQGLLLCKVMFKDILSEHSLRWINNELDCYDDPSQLPEYRIVDCDVKVQISGYYIGTKIEELDTSFIRKQMEGSDKPYASPNKMLIRQGIESIESSLEMTGTRVEMELTQGQIAILMRYYNYPANCRIVKVFQESNVESIRNIIPCVRNRLVAIIQSEVLSSPLYKITTDNKYKKKKVFISYGWESEEHRKWVCGLSERLSEHFDVSVDVKEPYGTELNAFMEQIISTADRVLLILTPMYKAKADARENGVGYESVLISSELYKNQGQVKFIPIIRKGTVRDSFPHYLGTRKGLDMTDDKMFEDKFLELVEDIKKY